MPYVSVLPDFAQFPFTRERALAANISDTVLRGSRVRRLFKGVYILATVDLSLTLWLRAALLAAPPGSVVSHMTAVRMYGFDLGDEVPFHLSTRAKTHTRRDGIKLHQRKAPISTVHIDGVPVTGANRTLVDIATKVDLVQLIQAIEFMVHHGHTSMQSLADYAMRRHLDGVRRMRRVLPYARHGVESPMETFVRLMLVLARLPEGEPNLNIHDELGTFLARGDLVYAAHLVLVEYDGWQHERDAQQRVHDIGRRERLEQAGWRLIIVTVGDLQRPHAIVRRVHTALVDRGYTGPDPVFSTMWLTWFVPRTTPA
ncbi:hypothetical protein [Aeromicrobium sp. UC242_57]|uniref:hypothetical protein n=1 Tax=Aeromicrobium sp. UC242_57 TaxID=3374624 RepID=UPI00379439B0